MLPRIFILLMAVGVFGCKQPPPPKPALPTSQDQEVNMAQIESIILAGKAVKAGSTHSGGVWVGIANGQILFAKSGRRDFQEFVKVQAPNPIPFYIE